MLMHIKNWLVKNNFHKILFWCFALLITYLTLTPLKDIKPIDFSYADKIVHFGVFLVLTYLFHLAYKIHTAWIWILLALYGLSIEILQELLAMGRTFDWYDWVFDLLGIIVGAFAYNKSNHLISVNLKMK